MVDRRFNREEQAASSKQKKARIGNAESITSQLERHSVYQKALASQHQDQLDIFRSDSVDIDLDSKSESD